MRETSKDSKVYIRPGVQGGVMKTDNAKRFLIAGLLLAVAVTGGNLAQAQSCSVEWTNKAGDGLWSTAGNWSTNQVPGPTSDVCILSTAGYGSCGAGCVDAEGIPSISVNSILIDQGPTVLFGPGTVSIATSLTVQGPRAASLGGGSSLVDLFGTNLNARSVQVGDSSNAGTFEGYGTVEGSITNNGALSPNGSLTVTGNYSQTTGGELFENWDLGVLNVNGNATLSGYLVLAIDTKHPPKSGSTDTVMTFGSLSGEFASVNKGFSVKYDKNSVVAKYQ
jgi:hypothetical protein